ncbi:MFS transporter [Acidiplasma aeolicum]|uniref:MFS transporter n=1 Tax=Acidiplasma aeolicum TaxID=507754 RepID=A0A0P9CPE1_9ARCH|nr:MFS transporter [Acidiplasma aeolicum]KPV47504.1 MFS transporter [Acidiplasma aeolicum]
MDNIKKLIPYWFFVFTIGFGWFIISPVVPELSKLLSTNLSGILLVLSAYGYTMAIIGLIAGILSAKFTVKSALYLAVIFSVIGLLARAFSNNYMEFLIFSLMAATAYPFSLAPVGSIAESMDPVKSATIAGLSIGFLFLGMSAGSLIGPYIFIALGIRGILLLPAVLAIIASAILIPVLKSYPARYRGKSLKGSFKIGMLKNWYVGLSMASISILFGGIASTVLGFHFSALTALKLSGLLSGLEFLGSAIGALLLPYIFEKYKMLRTGTVASGSMSFIFGIVLLISMVYTNIEYLIIASFFIFGFFGNAFWVLALNSIMNYVDDPARAGFATSMYSVATNVGVAIIPVFVGAEFSNTKTVLYGIVPAIVIVLLAFAVSPFLASSGMKGKNITEEETA